MASRKKERGILKLVNLSTKVKFYTNEEIIELDHIKDFLSLKSKNDKGLIIFMATQEFDVLYDYFTAIGLEIKDIKLFGIDYLIGFTVGKKDSNTYKTFYLMKYKIGTDEFDMDNEKDKKVALDLIGNVSSNQQSGYTSELRKSIKVEEEFLNFHVRYKPSLSPMIFAKCNREFFNVKCRDACSFYPFLLTQELPHFKGFIKKEDIDFNNKKKTYYGGLRIYNIKAKTAFCSISLIGEHNETEIAAGQGIGIINHGTRLVSADKIVIFGWLPFLIEELQDYDFDYLEISDLVAEYELKIDVILREIIIKVFEKKQEKKRRGEPYKAEKIMLNRYYGFFITKGNKSAPAHYGQFIVAKGKTIIRRLALEIGLEDVVQGHTDSIKFVGDHEDVIERYNSEIEFEELGKFANEGTMEKVIYYNTNRAKYLINGKLGLKHGGIADSDLKFIMKMDYDDIGINTEYFRTLEYIYDEEYGFYSIVKPKKFGGSL